MHLGQLVRFTLHVFCYRPTTWLPMFHDLLPMAAHPISTERSSSDCLQTTTRPEMRTMVLGFHCLIETPQK